MRTTLEIENDVMDAAKSLALARGVSVGSAVSQLIRRGVAARMPVSVRHGFPVFQVPPGTPGFGASDIAEAIAKEDLAFACDFPAAEPKS